MAVEGPAPASASNLEAFGPRVLPVSQWSRTTIGLGLYEDGVFADADAPPDVEIRDANDVVLEGPAPSVQPPHGIWNPADKPTGLYRYQLAASTTQNLSRGNTARWTWSVGPDDREYTYGFDVVRPMPFWDSLTDIQRIVVENAMFRVSQSFDSTVGGPYLWERPESGFSLETAARLAATEAISWINLSPPIPFNPPYVLGTGTPPIPNGWLGLLEQAVVWSLTKHLRRAYVEVPELVGAGVATLQRRDYMQRWGEIVADEKQQLDAMLAMLKRRWQLGVRTRASLIAGGLFPYSMFASPTMPRWPYLSVPLR